MAWSAFPRFGGVRGAGCGACLFLVSWLHRSHGLVPLRGLVWGVWYGVVV
jgi:hypothetical protein